MERRQFSRMFKKCSPLPGLTLFLLVSPAFLEAQGNEKMTFTSNQVFRALNATFSGDPLADLTSEEMRGLLTNDYKLTCMSDLSHGCTLDDAEGRLVVYPFLTTNTLFLLFIPSVRLSSSPSPILAALIARGTPFQLDLGNTIDFAISETNLSKNGRRGTLSEHLTFSIGDGTWVQSSATIKWSASK